MNDKNTKLLTGKQVKKIVSEQMTDRKKGISVSLWQPKETDMDRIVIKFPRNFVDFIGLTYITDKVLRRNKFHVAQVMGFMEKNKLWLLLVRDNR